MGQIFLDNKSTTSGAGSRVLVFELSHSMSIDKSKRFRGYS